MPLIAFRCSDELDTQIREAEGSASEVIRRALVQYFGSEETGPMQPALGDPEPAQHKADVPPEQPATAYDYRLLLNTEARKLRAASSVSRGEDHWEQEAERVLAERGIRKP